MKRIKDVVCWVLKIWELDINIILWLLDLLKSLNVVEVQICKILDVVLKNWLDLGLRQTVLDIPESSYQAVVQLRSSGCVSFVESRSREVS